MTDRYKGFLVTLENEIRSDDAEHIINALKMIKGVHSVKPYVKGMEDYISEKKAFSDAGFKIIGFIRRELFHMPDSMKKE